MAGKAGSLLIDIAANTAQLKSDFADAQRDVAQFGEKLAAVVTQISGFLSGLAIVDRIKSFAEEVSKAGIAAQEAANKYKLTSEQVQALQVISQRTGQSLSDLVKIGKANVDWLQQVTDEARKAGLVIDSEYTAALKRMADESEEADRRLRVLFAPAVTATKSWIAEAIERIANDLRAVAAHEGILDKIMALGRMLTYGGSVGSGQDFQLGERVKEVEAAERDLAALQRLREQAAQQSTARGYGGGPQDNGELAAAQKRVEDARIALAQYRDAQRIAEYGSTLTTLPPVTVTGGAGGGRSGDDAFARVLQSLKDQAEAAQDAIKGVATAMGLPTKELERQAQLDIDIARRTAQAIRSARTDDPAQKEQLAAAARQLEELKAKLADVLATQRVADQINEKYGDGTKKLADQVFYLDRAFAAGKISVEEYNDALRDYQRQAADQKDIQEGMRGGLEGMAAGWRSAMRQLNEPLADFKLGQQLFTDSFRLMSDAINEFVTTGTVDFGKLANSFAAMLADMAARRAAAGFFDALFDKPATATSAASSGWLSQFGTWLGGLFGFGGGRASGGPVQPGVVYDVGERGPEKFVSSVGGYIIPNSDAGGVTVNVANYSTANVTARPSKTAGGRTQIDIIVEAVEGKLAGRLSRGQGGLGRTMEGTYGLQRVGR